MRKYGISTVSLIPFSIGKRGFENSLDIARELRLDGIQALPMRGWSSDPNFYKCQLDEPWEKLIMSFEGPWNSGTVIQAVARTFGLKKEEYPTLLDLYLFGRKPKLVSEAMKNVFGWNKFVSHKFEPYICVVEIDPRASNQIEDYVNYKWGLVWDTCHVREIGMPNWRLLLSELPPESIKMIHFHPKDEIELAGLMNWRQNELTEMLEALRTKVPRDCPVILEIKPKIISQKSLMKRLCSIRDVASDFLG